MAKRKPKTDAQADAEREKKRTQKRQQRAIREAKKGPGIHGPRLQPGRRPGYMETAGSGSTGCRFDEPAIAARRYRFW